MQMKFRLMSVLALTVFTTFTACKKDSVPADKPSTELSTHSDDQNEVSNSMDDIANDANLAVESNSFFTGKMQQPQGIICNANVTVDTLSNPRTITISYNGNNCQGTHFRQGTVVLSMPSGQHWRDAGSAITVTYYALNIKRLSDNKSITINGTETITNVSGGLLIALANSQQPITHTLTSSNMSITFDDSTQRAWQVARQRVYTYDNGVVITITGTHTDGNNNHIAEWGTNRNGHAFATSTSQPLVIRQDCDFRLTSGEITHQGFATATATFGLNASGSATSCPGSGHYYYKLTWTGPNGGSMSVILPY
jgi:hypothetical protein